MPPEFHPLSYVQLLADHGVDYVIVGGVASRMQGSSTTTQDLDIMPEPSPANLQRLAWALSGSDTSKKPPNATTYEPHPLVGAIEFQTEELTSYRTANGVIDVIMDLPGVGGYDLVIRNARRYASGDIILHAGKPRRHHHFKRDNRSGKRLASDGCVVRGTRPAARNA